MKLVYKNEYKSITKFNDVELQDFTVLTGINGSGKSHLLEAIKEKSVEIGCENIVLFNFETFRLENESNYNTATIDQERLRKHPLLRDMINDIKSTISDSYPHLEIIKQTATKVNKPLLDLQEDDFNLTDFYEGRIDLVILEEYETLKKQCNVQLQYIKERDTGVYDAIRKIGIDKIIESSSLDGFQEMISLFTLKENFLPIQLGKVFWDYYVKYERNSFAEHKKRDYLTDEEFIQAHGEKPWDKINTILETFESLDYFVNSPEEENLDFDRGNFHLKLINKFNGAIVDFSNLSSGEKVLMALVASIYKTSSDNSFPDILLLDEIDASLHPSMTTNLLDVIKDVFLMNNMKVIMVTHSPSTIALSPEESLFVMNKGGENRIEKSTREKALDILTEGFVSLTNNQTYLGVTYDIGKNNLPVLFTEGITDKIILETAWNKLFDDKMPFIIQDAFDAPFLANLMKRGSEGSGIFNTYENRLFIALFDFDGEGYNQWNGLHKFSIQIEEDPRLCLTKKHEQENAYTMLLPVSDEIKSNVIKINNETYEDKSTLQIELLFYQVEQLRRFFRDKEMPGDGKIIEFSGKKTKFAKKINELEKEDFKKLQPLFDKIEYIISLAR